MSCCDARGRTKWGISALLVCTAFLFTSISAPVYFGILAGKSDPEAFKGCAHCIQDFGIEVLKSVNATDIADKLQKIHERNEKYHHHHHHHHHHNDYEHDDDPDFEEDECITSRDIDDLKPDLKHLIIPNWKEECKEVCTSVLKVVPLAAATSSVLFFIGICCGICAFIPLCMLCCGGCKDNPHSVQRLQPWQHFQPVYTAVPSAALPVGTSTAIANPVGETANTPLLQKL